MTYAEDTQIWNAIASDFKSRLPLRQLAWSQPLAATRAGASVAGSANTNTNTSTNSNSSTSASTNTASTSINSLGLDIKPFSASLLPKYTPGSLQLNSVFMHVFFVGCEDVEYYKNNVKKLIQDWLNSVMNKKSQEWLIVHLVGGGDVSAKGKGSTLFNINMNMGVAANVFDKIKTDFGLKKERIMQFRMSNNEIKDAEFWTELLERIKEGVITGISQQISQYEDDVRRFEQQRRMPGWNYCQYFILKEALASTYELINFYEEALLHYDELEATFSQTLAEQGAPWFHKFGGVEPGDDNPDVLNSDRKPYRDLIIQNNITIFDFREYLFSRQCRLALLLGSPADACMRTKLYAVSFAKTLREYSVQLSPHFREAWSFSIYEAMRAELLHMARLQLDHLGNSHGIYSNPLYLETSKTESTKSSPETAQPVSHPISNAELAKALESPDAYGELYQRISNLAARGFEASGRVRSALALQSDLAFWHFSRQNYEMAAQVWGKVAFKHANSEWHHIETVVIERLAICQRELGQHRQLVESCLYLAMYPQLVTEGKAEYFVDELHRAAVAMSEPIHRHGSELFVISIVSVVNQLGDDDDVIAAVNIKSVLAKEFMATKLALTLTAGDGKEMVCTAQDTLLHPGKNVVKVSCTSGNLHFHYDLHPNDRKKSVRIHETQASLKFSAYLPRNIVDGEADSLIEFEILTGQNAVSNPRLSFSALTGIQVILPVAQPIRAFVSPASKALHGQVREVEVKTEDNKLLLPEASQNERITFQLPFAIMQDSRSSDHKLKMVLSCVAEGGKRRLYSSIVRFNNSHPFAIKQKMFFEKNGTLVKVSITKKEPIPFRITALNVVASDWSTVTPVSPFSQHILFENTTYSSLFHVDAKQYPQEIESFVYAKLVEVLKQCNLTKFSGFLSNYLQKHVPIDAIECSAFGSIAIPQFVPATLTSLMTTEQADVQSRVIDAMRLLWQQLDGATLQQVQDTVSLIPTTFVHKAQHAYPHVLVQLSFKIADSVFETPIVVGDLVPAQFVVHPVTWDLLFSDTLHVEYEIDVDFAHFAMFGLRRHVFTLKGKTEEFPIMLCPLQAGQILLPNASLVVKQPSSSPASGAAVAMQTPALPLLSVTNICAGSQIAVLPRRQSAKIFLPDV
eukprot:jgi/Hompol1/6718/HPOL_002317-RA